MRSNRIFLTLGMALLMLTTSVPMVLGASSPTSPYTNHTDPGYLVANATGTSRPDTALVGLVPQGRQEAPAAVNPTLAASDDLAAYPQSSQLPDWYSEIHGVLQTGPNSNRSIATVGNPGDGSMTAPGQYQRLWSYPDQYWCGSGYPVGGADAANQTGPKGYYSMDVVITQPLMFWTGIGPSIPGEGGTWVDDNLLNQATSDPQGMANYTVSHEESTLINWVLGPMTMDPLAVDPNSSNYGYGSYLQLASSQLAQNRPPTFESYAVFVNCEVPNAQGGFTSHPTGILPQTHTYSPAGCNLQAGDCVRHNSTASRGIYGFYDQSSSTGGNPAVHANEFHFYGDCSDNLVIWPKDAPRTCDAGGDGRGMQVLTSAWYWDNTWAGQPETPLETLWGYAVQRFALNPVITSDYPQFYNSVFKDKTSTCLPQDPTNATGYCGSHPVFLQRSKFPPENEQNAAYSNQYPAPVAEDIEVIGGGTGSSTVSPVLFEAYGVATGAESCSPVGGSLYGVWDTRYCRATGQDTTTAMVATPPEPNFPSDPQETPTLVADDGQLVVNHQPNLQDWAAGWSLQLDVHKVNVLMAPTIATFDPIYGMSGQNGTMACGAHQSSSGTYAPDQSDASHPCNRQDVWSTGFYLNATLAFVNPNGQYTDNYADDRLHQEYIGVPDMVDMTPPGGNESTPANHYNLADVGFVGGGNGVSFDTPAGYVIRVNNTCVDNSGTTGVGNATNLSTSFGPPLLTGWVSSLKQTTLVNTTYGASEPAANPDVGACNAYGNASTGWGTFAGGQYGQNADWFGNGAGAYFGNVEYITPSSEAGLIRTHVTAVIHVPNGTALTPGMQEFHTLLGNPVASAMKQNTDYVLSDVDYYGTEAVSSPN